MSEHTRAFIENEGFQINKKITDDRKFYNRLMATHRKMVGIVEEIKTVENVSKEHYDELHRYVRTKFGQGKAWSTSLMLAMLKDIQLSVEERDKAMEAAMDAELLSSSTEEE